MSLVVVTAAMAIAGCAGAGNNDRYGGRGFNDPNRRVAAPNSDDRSDRWRQRYSRTYSYNDDIYYRECRNSPDPAGVIAGALIGGLLGNAAGSGRGGATIAGVIVGGVVGAALTSNLDCEDRSYAYKSYYDGFNSERPGSRYEWRNPRNDHRGEFRVGTYYNDPDGFRCANFTQTIYVQGRPREARGRACRQPDGTWAIVG
jgi:surface antigen